MELKKPGRVWVPIAVLLAGAAFVLFRIHQGYQDWEAGKVAPLGCETVPMLPETSKVRNAGSMGFPYGDVHGCRVLDRKARLLGEVEASTWFLLETDRGPVAIRADFRDLDMGWQWTSKAHELHAVEVAAFLPPGDRARLTEAITARGGPITQEWILHYGDG